jgi:hypothetical protein
MQNIPRLRAAIGAGIVMSLSGCASIMSGRHADVSFYSNVPDAHVVVRNKRGEEVASALAPSTVALRRKDRWIFPAKYFATFEAPGYQSVEVPIRSKVNPWVLGNVPFLYAGIVGLAVDNVTGAAWSPRESTIYQELTPIYTAQNSPPNPTLSSAKYSTAQLPENPAAQMDSPGGVEPAAAIY